MNLDLLDHPALQELRQAVAELSLVSHISALDYQGMVDAKDTTESKGGRRPPGADGEFKPRKPRHPGPDASEKELATFDGKMTAFQTEHDSWLACYQRKTPSWFSGQVERCETEYRLVALADEARDVVDAWRRMPLPAGGEPVSMRESHWKRWVGEMLADPKSGWDVKRIVNRYGCSRQYVYKVNRAMNEGGLMPVSDERDRDQEDRPPVSVSWPKAA